MAAFSDYLESGILEHTLRGTTLPTPSSIYVALFTSDPTDADTGDEVTDSAYVRQDAAKGDSISSGWTSPTDSGDGKVSSNAKVIQFPPIADGSVTVTHYALYDAQSGGNMLYHGEFTVAKTLEINDVLSVDIGGIQVILR
ncbi:hypothetical protein [Halomonas elongata]|uniref:Homolog to phage protein MTPG_00003 n=1 Tax=Halomonas elongata (strain ATCC 33173 / DSM 2581 / NBRC 15536 / NCIMB 2198 / 1H9) TaxID=768066 RepID=E1V344_HALED|nr:hypothetical protein [Halomonas elongata]WBF19804.1 hypothetical protein LM502_08995 [Halomonas elongata]WPU48673.1 hypothetical protein SR933_07220 [Halomonas elongata DSM 2581]CBV42523.1 homolog to phage protein MTPG_00003 [Halomonas elongata DSM 2581]